MNAKFLIRVGSGAEYQLRYGRRGCDYSVFRKILNSSTTYIIAREVVSRGQTQPVPTSVLREYASQDEAVAALDKWATSRRDPPLLKPQPHPTAYTRRNCNRPKRGKVGADQMDFTF